VKPETGAKENALRTLVKVMEKEVPPVIVLDTLTTLKLLVPAVYPQATLVIPA
jgi:hypothetical protein